MTSWAPTDEHQLLRDAVAGFLTARYDFDGSRRAARTGAGWQPDVWRGFAEELGILGATLPARVGGSGGGPAESAVIAEELGRALVVEPFVETAVLGARLLTLAGGGRADALLRDIVSGQVRLAVATTQRRPGETTTTARRDGAAWALDGTEIVVVGAPVASHLLVPASVENDGGLGIFVVDAQRRDDGMTVHGYRTIDDRRAADLVFDGLRLDDDALLGSPGAAAEWLAEAIDHATVAAAADAVGCMRRALADTVRYAKQRQQFGQPIGRFQVLAHRMVDMHMEVEQAAAAVELATRAVEANASGRADADARALAVSAAKATVGRAARFVGQSAVQIHGGMGMTQELAVGHCFARLTAFEHAYGGVDHHIARYARLTRR